MTADELPDPGEHVVDRRTGDDLVVVEVHAHTPADEFVLGGLDGNPTVATVNPGFAGDAPVVDCVYPTGDTENLAEVGPVLAEAVRRDALDRTVYSFPAGRLSAAGDEEGEP